MWASADRDLLADDLIHKSEREAIEHSDPPIARVLPLSRRRGELKDQFERRVDLVFQLGAECGLLPDTGSARRQVPQNVR